MRIHAYILFTWIIINVVVAVTIGASITWALGSILLFTIILALINKHTPKNIAKSMLKGLQSVSMVLFTLSSIGMLIGVWNITGTIPALINLGFQWLIHLNIVLAAFIVSGLLSMLMGTAIGTLSTIGLVFVGLGQQIGVPLPLITGAIVSGAYLGDRSSPVSSSAHLCAAATATSLEKNLKEMMRSLIPGVVLAILFYWLWGNPYQPSPETFVKINALTNAINSIYTPTWIHFISPIILILGTSVFRMGTRNSIGIALFFSIVFGFFHQISIPQLLSALLWGYHTTHPMLESLVKGGGFISMVTVLEIVCLSAAFNGILENTALLDPLLKGLTQSVKTPADTQYKSGLLAFLVAAITCNQSLPILMTGKRFSDRYDHFKIPKYKLARVISDTGVIVVPLIPWNVNALIVQSITQTNAMQYSPYAVLCWTLPIITLVIIYLDHKKTH